MCVKVPLRLHVSLAVLLVLSIVVCSSAPVEGTRSSRLAAEALPEHASVRQLLAAKKQGHSKKHAGKHAHDDKQPPATACPSVKGYDFSHEGYFSPGFTSAGSAATVKACGQICTNLGSACVAFSRHSDDEGACFTYTDISTSVSGVAKDF